MRLRIFLFVLLGVCMLAPTRTDAQEAQPPIPVRQPESAPPQNGMHHDTIISMQKELKRVGCYVGPLDGLWRREAREALQEFGRSVRLEIDADKPDEVTLLIVEGHSSQVCCPMGQHRGVTGQCQGEGIATAALPPPAPEQSPSLQSPPTVKEDRGQRTAEGSRAREPPRGGDARKPSKSIEPKRAIERREAAATIWPQPSAVRRDRTTSTAGRVGDVIAGGF